MGRTKSVTRSQKFGKLTKGITHKIHKPKNISRELFPNTPGTSQELEEPSLCNTPNDNQQNITLEIHHEDVKKVIVEYIPFAGQSPAETIPNNANPALNTIIQDGPSKENKPPFPIFTSGHKPKHEPVKTNTQKRLIKVKKFIKPARNQALLDFGQKKFGIVQCPRCEYVYDQGDPQDEMKHEDHHTGKRLLKFAGWRQERVIAEGEGERIIKILPQDSGIWRRKVVDLMEFIQRELGWHYIEFSLEKCQVFLYIRKKRIIGCLVATEMPHGYKLVSGTSDSYANVPCPIKCGIPRIWVAESCRGTGVGTQMMDVLKSHFLPDVSLENSDIAFAIPNEDCKEFAKKYFRNDNFLVYF
ncbi:unnamed protein product [Phyllotreta striolata]|uniref:Uncharacterized protein n=1 Tax=Phyllotreta striolata TaxID=444603 RepID=A0A9P0DQZ7_PHYSR|nr:unnamed protein product [Phyllotreta striolata]